MSVLLAKNVDLNKIKYSEVKTLSSGAKSVYINYGIEKLNIQTPVLSMPYGIGLPYESKDSTKKVEKKFDITMSLRGIEDNVKISSFHDKIKEIESKIIDDAFTNRLAWFKDDFDGNKAVIAKLFHPIIKIDKDKETGKIAGKYPATFKAKLPYDIKNDRFTFDAFNMENEELEFETIMNKLKGGKIQGIIQLTGLWFAGGKYGCTWKLNSAKFQLYQSYKMEFIEDSDTEKIANDDEDEDDITVDNDVKVTHPLPQEEEEEEEDEEESEVAVAAPPPPARKTPAPRKK